MMDAIRPHVEFLLGAPVEFVIDDLRVVGKMGFARVSPQRPDLVAKAVIPDYALGPHTASLGLAYSGDNSLAEPFRHGMFVGQHGSWNRKELTGYNVVFVPFADGRPSGPPQPFLTGFLSKDGDAYGRPVGVALDGQGALLVADDVGNVVWRVVRSE
jgi:glucose/arabinose dehydrogenase